MSPASGVFIGLLMIFSGLCFGSMFGRWDNDLSVEDWIGLVIFLLGTILTLGCSVFVVAVRFW